MLNKLNTGRLMKMHRELHDMLQYGTPNNYQVIDTGKNGKISFVQNIKTGETFWVNSDILGILAVAAPLRLVK